MKQWDQGPLSLSFVDDVDIVGSGTAAVTSTSTQGVGDVISISSEFIGGTASTQEVARWTLVHKLPLAKLLCHKIVDHISDKGMPELCEAMAEIYDFDRRQSDHLPKSLPLHQTVQADHGRSYQRPDFHLAED